MPFEKIVDKPKVSTWWWLLPIFLTAMGGILMFIALRKENYAVALKGLFLGFIIAGICIVIYVGIIGYEMYLIDQALEKELKMQEAIEESLDIIDEKYNNLNKILEIPVFYNSPEVKSVIAEIQDTRDALLYIANQLVKDKKTLEEEVSIEKEKDTTT